MRPKTGFSGLARDYLYLACLAGVLILAFLVYSPGLSGDFSFDDITNIRENENLRIQAIEREQLYRAAFSGQSGPLKRPISMLSFGLNYYFSGFDPYFYKLTNLFIHLLNGACLFLLTYLVATAYRKLHQPNLTSAQMKWLSLAVGSAWLLHPLNLTGVLYVVQRMTSLSALFIWLGTISYLWGRLRLLDDKRGILLIATGTVLFGTLATLSKETGALLPLFIWTLEICLFRFQTSSRAGRIFLFTFFSLIVALPIALLLAYVMGHPGWITGGYAIREFSLLERVLTESRVLWFYLQMTIMPDLARLGLHHDDFPISHNLLTPASTLPAMLGIGALLAVALFARRRAPMLALGLMFFLVGHSMESTVFALELVHEHRNYLPAYGILLIVFYYLLYPLKHFRSLRYRYIATVALIVVFATGTLLRATHWGNPAELAVIEARNHPESARANFDVGRLYEHMAQQFPAQSGEYYTLAHDYFERATSADHNFINGLVGLILMSYVTNRPIDKNLVVELQDRLQNRPFGNGNTLALATLVVCQRAGNCNLSAADISSIFSAALSNSTLSGPARAAVLSMVSDLYVIYGQGSDKALEFAYLAIEVAPDEIQYRLNLINLLIISRKFEAAGEEIVLAKARDTLGTYAKKIAEKEILLHKVRSALNGSG